LLNLGQAVAWDNYIGRGVRRNHPEDYPEYIRGGDIISFDIYPVVHDSKEIAGHLEYVARGLERLRQWSGGERVIWNCIECTPIGNPNACATPEQIRAEVWMSIIHGSRGLIYFVHQFKPTFKEAALLEEPEILAAVTRINAEVQSLAPVINKPVLRTDAVVESTSKVPVATMFRELNGTNYLFAVCMRNERTTTTFNLPSPQHGEIEVLGEARSIPAGSNFEEKFEPYAVHLYRWKAASR
jgi:hypothetical protein